VVLAKWLPHLVLASLAAVLVPGCQGQEAPPGFIVLMDSAPKGLDPRFATSDASAKLVALLHAGLISTDNAAGKAELYLAESIDQSSPIRYEVRLRDEIYFHDGTPVTSADVHYTFMELTSDLVKSPYGGIARRIKSFSIIDAQRFVIELRQPHAPFINDLALGIVPKAICSGNKECPGDPIGAGPFRFESREGDTYIAFRSFDRFFAGKPHLDRVVFKVVKDDNTRLLALLGHTADLVQNAVPPLMLPVVQDSSKLELVTGSSFKYTYLSFNLRHGLLSRKEVRKAIAHGIDRAAIIDYKFGGRARLSTGLLAPDHWAYRQDVPTYEYNPDLARKILDDAGLVDPDGPDGPKPRFRLELKVSSNKFRKAVAGLIGHQLKDIGIEVRVRAYEWGTFFSDIKSGNFEMTTLQWPSVLEPSLYRWIFHSDNIPTPENRSAGANRGAYKNALVDTLLDRGNSETDPAQRKATYGELQRILAEDLPYISLWHEDNVAVIKRGVKDYYVTPNARFAALKTTRSASGAEGSP
jgi:peptide/nickel transport system substrate-binding protein